MNVNKEEWAKLSDFYEKEKEEKGNEGY